MDPHPAVGGEGVVAAQQIQLLGSVEVEADQAGGPGPLVPGRPPLGVGGQLPEPCSGRLGCGWGVPLRPASRRCRCRRWRARGGGRGRRGRGQGPALPPPGSGRAPGPTRSALAWSRPRPAARSRRPVRAGHRRWRGPGPAPQAADDDPGQQQPPQRQPPTAKVACWASSPASPVSEAAAARRWPPRRSGQRRARSRPRPRRPGPAGAGPAPGPGCCSRGPAGLLGDGEVDPLAGPEHPAGGVGGVEGDLAATGQSCGDLDADRPGHPGVASGHGLRATLTRVAATSGVESAWPAPGLGSWPRGHRTTAHPSTVRAITPTTA
jgi:hypothetical protein